MIPSGDLSWLAGFYAAEGCLSRNNRGYTCLSITQKEVVLLELIRDMLGCGHISKSTNASNLCVTCSKADKLHKELTSLPMDLDWAVGFWEGDGSIQANKGYFNLPVVSFTNNNIPRLEQLAALFPSGKIYRKSGGTGALTLLSSTSRDFVLVLGSRVKSPRRRLQLTPYLNTLGG